MPKGTALSTIDINIPDEIWDLLGDPPALSETEACVYEAILARFAQAVHPRDIIEWFFVRDLAVYRAAIQRFQCLKTRLIQQVHRNQVQVQADRILSSGTSEIRKALEADAIELAAKIKELKGEPDEIKAETEKLEAESKANAAARLEKIKAETCKSLEENETASTVEETATALFGKWIEPYERVDRSLIAEQKKFKETLRDMDDYRRGLGELLRHADADIVDAEFEEKVIPTEENRPQVHASEVPIPSQIIDLTKPPPFTIAGIGHLPPKLGAG
jgi:hypothetical protein